MVGRFLWEKWKLESLFSYFYKDLLAFSYPKLRLLYFQDDHSDIIIQ